MGAQGDKEHVGMNIARSHAIITRERSMQSLNGPGFDSDVPLWKDQPVDSFFHPHGLFMHGTGKRGLPGARLSSLPVFGAPALQVIKALNPLHAFRH